MKLNDYIFLNVLIVAVMLTIMLKMTYFDIPLIAVLVLLGVYSLYLDFEYFTTEYRRRKK